MANTANLDTLAGSSTLLVEERSLEHVRAELSRARQVARAWAETIPEALRADQAGAFALRALLSHAAVSVPDVVLGVGSLDFHVDLDDVASELARGIGRIASRLSTMEALHHLTSLYPTLLPDTYRSSLGAFYTPPCLVNRLLDQATAAGLDWTTAKVLDPAAGGGIFLVHAAERMLAALGECEPQLALRNIENRLQGFELDSNAAALAQVALEVLLADKIKAAGRPAAPFVRVCDTLEATANGTFDLVVGNPPYGRVTLTEEARNRYARSLYGHANLYGIFTDAALRWARRGGFIAYITPTSFLGGQYYSTLRSLLSKQAPPLVIDFVHARKGVFEDVLQETLLALYEKGGRSPRPHIGYVTVANEREATITSNGTIAFPKDAKAPWLAPRDPKHAQLISSVERMPTRLADWGYRVSTGPLVWNRYKSQLREKVGRDIYPLVWAESVSCDGRFVFRAEKRNHAPYFKLEPADAWLLVKQACVLVQRTTAKEQQRRLIAAELPESFIDTHGGVVVENHLNMVWPRGRPKISPAVVAALLNSSVVDEIFRCISGSVAVSAFELNALPLPLAEEMEPLELLIAQGAPPAAIDRALRKLYLPEGQ